MAASRLPTLGLLLLLSIGVCLSSETNALRQIRSLTSHLRTLREVADNARRARFVGQLATDCGLECKRNNGEKTELQAKRVDDQVQQAKKRFMSLAANDCESFGCVVRKRLAMEKVKRFLVEKQEAGSLKRKREQALSRHKDYFGSVLGGADYGGGNQGGQSYGSQGFSNYGKSNYGNSQYDDDDDDYYYDDEDYDEDEEDEEEDEKKRFYY